MTEYLLPSDTDSRIEAEDYSFESESNPNEILFKKLSDHIITNCDQHGINCISTQAELIIRLQEPIVDSPAGDRFKVIQVTPNIESMTIEIVFSCNGKKRTVIYQDDELYSQDVNPDDTATVATIYAALASPTLETPELSGRIYNRKERKLFSAKQHTILYIPNTTPIAFTETGKIFRLEGEKNNEITDHLTMKKFECLRKILEGTYIIDRKHGIAMQKPDGLLEEQCIRIKKHPDTDWFTKESLQIAINSAERTTYQNELSAFFTLQRIQQLRAVIPDVTQEHLMTQLGPLLMKGGLEVASYNDEDAIYQLLQCTVSGTEQDRSLKIIYLSNSTRYAVTVPLTPDETITWEKLIPVASGIDKKIPATGPEMLYGLAIILCGTLNDQQRTVIRSAPILYPKPGENGIIQIWYKKNGEKIQTNIPADKLPRPIYDPAIINSFLSLEDASHSQVTVKALLAKPEQQSPDYLNREQVIALIQSCLVNQPQPSGIVFDQRYEAPEIDPLRVLSALLNRNSDLLFE